MPEIIVMPELPEVETIKNGVTPFLLNQRIERMVVRRKQLRWPIPEVIQQLENVLITQVARRAKYLLITTEQGQLLVHLGMSGVLRVVPQGTPANTHDHVDMLLSNGCILRYTDPRRFGAWLWTPKPNEHQVLSHLGPEPLSEEFDGELLYERSRNRRQAVKTFIMDNKIVVGVGNIYAQEALFMAGVHPSRAAGRISRQRYVSLAEAIKTVLAAAITAGGTTLKDFTKADGQPGYFQQELAVYGRGGKPCQKCNAVLLKTTHGQRTTVYCGSCQT